MSVFCSFRAPIRSNWPGATCAGPINWCANSPNGVCCVRYQGQPQGWFLSSLTGQGLYLALAMLSQTAQISGLHLYQAAFLAYAAKGARIGHAGFSARNTAVLNIYSQLGARFTPAEGIWLWHPGNASAKDYQ